MRRLRKLAILPLSFGFWVQSSAAPEAASVGSVNLTVSRFSLLFPETQVRSRSTSEQVFIRNMGDEAATMLSVVNTCLSDFSLYDDCGFDLAPGQACSVSVTFAPTRVGYNNCHVSVTALNGNSVRFSVSGRAVEPRLRPTYP